MDIKELETKLQEKQKILNQLEYSYYQLLGQVKILQELIEEQKNKK